MVWKYVNISDTGTASKFGADDLDKIGRAFSGIDVDDFDINLDCKIRSTKLQIRNPANTFAYIITSAAIAADRILNLPLLTTTDTLVAVAFAQTLSNKTLDSTCIVDTAALSSDVVKEGIANDFGDFDNSFKDNRIRIWNPADSFRYTLIAAAIAANRNLTLPLLTGNDTVVAEAHTQTLTNKTISAASNTLTGVTRTIVKSGVNVVINTTSAETSMFSQNIVGNTMGANGVLHLRLFGSLFQNQVTGTTYTLRVKFGGTTIYEDATASIAQSSTSLPYILEIYLYNTNATNAQRGRGTFMVNDVSAATTGTGDISDDETQINAVIGLISGTKDTTLDQTLDVTIQMSVSNASVETSVNYSWLEVNPS